jgi:hypothetical protein
MSLVTAMYISNAIKMIANISVVIFVVAFVFFSCSIVGRSHNDVRSDDYILAVNTFKWALLIICITAPLIILLPTENTIYAYYISNHPISDLLFSKFVHWVSGPIW